MLVTDISVDFFKLLVYVTFFAILFTFYGLPIHILRDVVLTMRSFGKRIIDFLRYRNATRDMNERYADATPEEVAREDVCIICREEMRPWQPPEVAGVAGSVPDRLRPKKLPCGHILHFACLRSWLERQQNCPTCRRPLATATGARAFTRGPDAGDNFAGAAQQQVHGANQGAAPNAPAGGRPRAWFLNLGPIRIGFGAGRGDLLQNLAQQAQAQAPQQPNANQPPAGAQHIGFGFGFGRQPPQPAQPTQPAPQGGPYNHIQTQMQIQQLEQQITQEFGSLRATAEQLQVVRLLHAELTRLRAAQMTPALLGQHPPPMPPASTTIPPAAAPSHIPTFGNHRQFTSTPQHPAIHAGDARLPEGLALPQGWSLLPLQRVEQQGQQQHQAPPYNNLFSGIPLQPPVSSHPPQSSQTYHIPSGIPGAAGASGAPGAPHAGFPREGLRTSSLFPTPAERPDLTSSLSRRASSNSMRNDIHAERIDSVLSHNTQERQSRPATPSFWGNANESSSNQQIPSQNNTNAGPSTTSEPANANANANAESAEQSSSSKGKARAATVEDCTEDES